MGVLRVTKAAWRALRGRVTARDGLRGVRNCGTVAEASEAVLRLLPDVGNSIRTKRGAGMCREAIAATAHHGLGMVLRNELGLWEAGPGECSLKDHFVAMGFRHPDDMSGLLLEDLVKFAIREEHLTRIEIDSLRSRYDEHWLGQPGGLPDPWPKGGTDER